MKKCQSPVIIPFLNKTFDWMLKSQDELRPNISERSSHVLRNLFVRPIL